MSKKSKQAPPPLPWEHWHPKPMMSAVLDATGKLVCGSMICAQEYPGRIAAHAWIVEQVNAALQVKKMARLLDQCAHSVYCNDQKEQKRLRLPGCPRCAWDKMKKEMRRAK